MDLGSIGAATSAFRNAIELVKAGKELLPKHQQEAVTKSLEEAERQAKLAEAKMAKGLGYRLCGTAQSECPWLALTAVPAEAEARF